MKKFISLLLCNILMLGFATTVKAAESKITLVENGKANSTIVTAKNPTPSVNLAAKELQYFVKLTTGATLPIADDSKDVSGSKILIGKSKYTDKVKI